MNRAAIALLVVSFSSLVWVGAACAKKSGTRALTKDQTQEVEALTKAVCSCADKACSDVVSEQITAWFSGFSFADYDKAANRELARHGEQMASCIGRFVSDAGVAADLPPTDPAGQATTLLTAARTWAQRTHPAHHLEQTTISYVDAAGVLDPDHGELAVQLGTPSKPTDDPKRRTGAPIKPAGSAAAPSCPVLYWSRSAGWSSSPWTCRTLEPHVARCSPQQVWKRAIEKGAPADALAVMTLERAPDSAPMWRFKISDPPRKIDISESFADDCELAVEAQ
ncbi:MAG: hypothetical protein M3619_14250 [Myxococcota bacterium]|nr:hypothetical protein [Myxococcota bacterium]